MHAVVKRSAYKVLCYPCAMNTCFRELLQLCVKSTFLPYLTQAISFIFIREKCNICIFSSFRVWNLDWRFHFLYWCFIHLFAINFLCIILLIFFSNRYNRDTTCISLVDWDNSSQLFVISIKVLLYLVLDIFCKLNVISDAQALRNWSSGFKYCSEICQDLICNKYAI